MRHFVHALGSREPTTTSRRALLACCPASRSARFSARRSLAAGSTSRWFDDTFSPAVFLTYPVPKIGMLPIFMLWFGIGDFSKVLIIALACFYPVFINSYYGAKGAPWISVWSAQNMGAEARRDLPARGRAERCADDLRRHAGLARAFLHRHVRRRDDQRAPGLGHMIRVAENSLRFDLMYVSLLAIAILGYAGDRLVRYSHRKPSPGRSSRHEVPVHWNRAGRLGSGGAQRPVEQDPVPLARQASRREPLAFLTRTLLMEAWTSLYRASAASRRRGARRLPRHPDGPLEDASPDFDPLFSGTYAVPKLALFPIFIFVFGIGSLSKVRSSSSSASTRS